MQAINYAESVNVMQNEMKLQTKGKRGRSSGGTILDYKILRKYLA